MQVGFFTVFRRDPHYYGQAALLLASIRSTMPGVPVTHFTDDTSPPVPGVDDVRRLPHGKMLGVRLAHYGQCDGDWLLLDTDTLVRRDVRHILTQSFDIALADRNWSWLPQTPEVLATMPYNTGVIFSKSPHVWQEVLTRWMALPDAEQDWLSEQRVVASVLASGRYRCAVLPGAVYNCPVSGPTPQTTDSHAAIVHFKGPRKHWMASYAKTLALGQPSASSSERVFRVFIGYDPRQPVAYHVAAHSVLKRASVPVAITPLRLHTLPTQRRGLTEFTYSRFLVPWLCGYNGMAVFLDADTLCLGDIRDLLASVRGEAPVHVVPHEDRLRFERASVMVFDCDRCQMLTPESVADTRQGLLDLAWTNGTIGALPSDWNVLVGYQHHPSPKLIHYTQGVPVWPETGNCEYADVWRRELADLTSSVSFAELMGASVHIAQMSR